MFVLYTRSANVQNKFFSIQIKIFMFFLLSVIIYHLYKIVGLTLEKLFLYRFLERHIISVHADFSA